MKKLIKPKKQMRIVVGTNSLTESQYPAYTNHCQFWFRLGRSYPHIEFIFMNPSRMSIDRMRNAAAKVSLESNADYLLFLDDDVLVNPNHGLQQLLDCNADLAAGRVVIRGYPFDYMVFKWNKEKTGLFPQKDLPAHGVHPYDAVGFSFALINTSILKTITEPWFVTGPTNTEDIYFCIKAKALNPKMTIKVNCDCDCGHILWPEIMDRENRLAYMQYFERMNPSVKVKPPLVNPSEWRGDKYLKEIKNA